MPEPADPNAYIDNEITNRCDCTVKNDGEISAADKRKMITHHKRCAFRRRAVEWLGWENVDTIARAQ